MSGHPVQGCRNYHWVDCAAELERICALFEPAHWLCLDTEFVREQTFSPVPGLLQIASLEVVACVDLVALPYPEPLFDLIYQPQRIKVFHSAVQDLEIFYQIRQALPAPVFDTQVAAPLLGFPEQISYAGLVAALLGDELDKAHTRTDWTKRPLSDAQINYAVEDVVHLTRLYQEMRDRLARAGRLEWLADDFAALADEQRYRFEPDKAWRRISTAKISSGQELAIVQTLAAWREARALNHNRPRTWILKDQAILDIARRKPRDRDELSGIKDLPNKLLRDRGEEILALVRDAALIEQPMGNVKPPGLTAKQQVQLEKLGSLVQQQERQEHLQPGVLLSNKALRRLVRREPVNQVVRGWRYRMIGALLERFIEALGKD